MGEGPTYVINGSFRRTSNGFSNSESREVSLNGNVYDFLIDYISIDKSDMLNIHKYLINKKNIK